MGFQISEFSRTRKAVVKFAGKITITTQILESPYACVFVTRRATCKSRVTDSGGAWHNVHCWHCHLRPCCLLTERRGKETIEVWHASNSTAAQAQLDIVQCCCRIIASRGSHIHCHSDGAWTVLFQILAASGGTTMRVWI